MATRAAVQRADEASVVRSRAVIKPPFLQMTDPYMAELNRLSAAEAARQIAAGKITSEALVRDCLERIKARDGEAHAWVYCDPEIALAQARAIDKGGAKGPL